MKTKRLICCISILFILAKCVVTYAGESWRDYDYVDAQGYVSATIYDAGFWQHSGEGMCAMVGNEKNYLGEYLCGIEFGDDKRYRLLCGYEYRTTYTDSKTDYFTETRAWLNMDEGSIVWITVAD